MRKISDFIEKTLAVVGTVMFLWIFISWVNVLLARPEVSAWNIFNFL